MATAQGGLNIGDIIFQLVMFFIIIGIPLVLIVVFFVFNKRNKRLKLVEEKLDKLLEEKENKNT